MPQPPTESEGAAESGGHEQSLLRADEAALEQLGELLMEAAPVFVLVVCRPALRPLARRFLASHLDGMTLLPAFALADADAVLASLTHVAQSGAAHEVWSFELVGGSALDDSLRALNWHREKLLGRGRSIVWLDDLDQLRLLREIAPDAYSFRETLIILRGDDNEKFPLLSENEAINRARTEVSFAKSPQERAEALHRLAYQVALVGLHDEARKIATQALHELVAAEDTPERKANENHRTLRADLLLSVANFTYSVTETTKLIRSALAELELVEGADSDELRCVLLASVPGPFTLALDLSEKALEISRSLLTISPESRSFVLRQRAACLCDAGDFRAGLSLCDEVFPFTIYSKEARAHNFRWRGWYRFKAGLTTAAEVDLREALDVGKGAEAAFAMFYLADVMCFRGELSAAERFLTQVRSAARSEPLEAAAASATSAEIASLRGDFSGARLLLSEQFRSLADRGYDHIHVQLVEQLANLASAAHAAGLLDDTELRKTIQTVATEAGVSQALVGDDAPWSSIRFLAWQSDLLASCDEISEATARADQGLQQARRTCQDLRAFAARRVTARAIERNDLAYALELIDELEGPAAEAHILRDASELAAQRVLALSKLGTNALTLAAAVSRVQELVDRSGAPAIAAVTWLELGKKLSPDIGAQLDPVVVLDKALDLYRTMQWPAHEADALEAIGDVHAARDQKHDAKTYYLSARACLLASEVRQRLPLLESKLGALAALP